MRQYVLPESYDSSGSLTLRGQDFHYLTRVLRKQDGDRFDGLDPRGGRVSVLVRSVLAESCVLQIGPSEAGDPLDSPTGTSKNYHLDAAPDSNPAHDRSFSHVHGTDAPVFRGAPTIILFQCLPKGQKMDLIVRQATETGVARICPVVSDHSVSRIHANDAPKKRDRWLRVARQAMQQSGSSSAPEVSLPAQFSDIQRIWSDFSDKGDLCLFFHQEQIGTASLHSLLASDPKRVGICIGPEGGFSESEVGKLLHSGFQPVYINTNVLRTETAALYAIASVQTALLEKDSWKPRRG